jgi:hypothetical protein
MDTFEFLDDVEAGQLIKAIFKYQNGYEIDKSFNGRKHLQIAFLTIEKTFIRDTIKYEEKCKKNAEIAQEAWNKRKQEDTNACERIESYANYADSNSVSDNASVSGSNTENEYISTNKEIYINSIDILEKNYPKEVRQEEKEKALRIYQDCIEKENIGAIEFELKYKECLENYNRPLPEFSIFLLENVIPYIRQYKESAPF